MDYFVIMIIPFITCNHEHPRSSYTRLMYQHVPAWTGLSLYKVRGPDNVASGQYYVYHLGLWSSIFPQTYLARGLRMQGYPSAKFELYDVIGHEAR